MGSGGGISIEKHGRTDIGWILWPHVQGEIWGKGEIETMQESQGENGGKVGPLRKAKKPLEREGREREEKMRDPCRHKPLFPRALGLPIPSQ